MFDSDLQEKLTRFALALVDQQAARVIVPPVEPESGFWFGGGNLAQADDGTLCLVGRYRNAGDSRTGVAAGTRGFELAVFASGDGGRTFEKVLRLQKADLAVDGREVLSIEGSALRFGEGGVELYVSSEKQDLGYPPGLEEFLKPGTGVWTVDRLAAATIDGLSDAPRETVLASRDPRFLHVKDPFVCGSSENDDFVLGFCTHPFCWTSSNAGYAVRRHGNTQFDEPEFDFFPRGFTWDVAMTRGTCVMDVPRVGAFRERRVSLVFYDGGECVRRHDEHSAATSRPRGYSCEELGGVGYFLDGDLARIERLSLHRPMFISPHGTGCSRYVDVLASRDGFHATWQQSQSDGSQPLVMNFVERDVARELLE